MTISPTTRIIVLIAVAVLLGLGGFLLLDLGHKNAATKTPVAHHSATTHVAPHTSSSTTRPAVSAHHAAAIAGLSSTTLPSPLVHALRYHKIVVAVLYAPGVASEAGVVSLARQGAHAAHAGFVALNVRGEKTAEGVALSFPGAFDPSVLIVNHHGVAVTRLDGVQESAAVAQAVTDARR